MVLGFAILVLELDPTRLSPARAAEALAASPTIAAAGDIACAPPANPTATLCRQMDTSNLLVDAGLAGVLTLGDAQYENGELANFNAVYDPSWGRVKAITRPSVGNHEYQTTNASGYFSYFGAAAGDPAKGYYSFDIGAWHLIALNSNCARVSCAAGSAQEQWLQDDLAAHPNQCTLAYWHHPRFSSGMHGNFPTTQPLWQALYDAGADVVLSGHDHTYERFAPQTPTGAADPAHGIRQFVVGTGGDSSYQFQSAKPNSEVRSTGTFGVLKLTLHPHGYDWRFAPIAGATFSDTGSAGCHNYPVPMAASQIKVSLVPNYRQCATQATPASGAHAPPLAAPSCRPPATLGSSHIGARNAGSAMVSVVPADLTTPANEADAFVVASMSDVRAGGPTGADYNPNATGPDMTLLPRLRITDSRNGTSQEEPGTVTELHIGVPLNCVSTADTNNGANCNVNTTVNAVVPGTIVEGNRTVIQFFRIRVEDAGPNGLLGDADDPLSAQQGVYVP